MTEQSRLARTAPLVVPLILGVVSTLLWSLAYDDAGALRNDASRYYTMACELADGRFGALGGREGGLFLDPGYPLVLAAWLRVFGSSVATAQMLNVVLWGLSAAMLAAIVRRWLPPKPTLMLAGATALSPMLTSFAPKLYSEHLAITGLLLAILSWLRSAEDRPRASRVASRLLFAAAGAIVVLTKAAFFPLAALLLMLLLVMRRWWLAATVAGMIALVTPLHVEVQRGGRSLMAGAHQVAMVERWPTSVALKCGVYSLSWNLGLRVFPEVEGACEPFLVDDRKPMAELNARRWSERLLDEGFTVRDQLRTAVTRPGKYLLICGANLLGAVWLEGLYPQPLEPLPGASRSALWLFKVVLSTSLWLLAVAGAWRALQLGLWRLAAPLMVPMGYILFFHANVLGEQRYFFPLIPLLYASASFTLKERAASTECYDSRQPRASGDGSRIARIVGRRTERSSPKTSTASTPATGSSKLRPARVRA